MKKKMIRQGFFPTTAVDEPPKPKREKGDGRKKRVDRRPPAEGRWGKKA